MNNVLYGLVKGYENDFIEKLYILHIVVNINLKLYGFDAVLKNSSEINFSDLSINLACKFSGKYFENKQKNFSIWLGYYAEYDFCISFWVKDSEIKYSILKLLEDKDYDCLCNSSGAMYKGQQEKYWLNVKLHSISNMAVESSLNTSDTDNSSSVQNEINSIMKLITDNEKIKNYIDKGEIRNE